MTASTSGSGELPDELQTCAGLGWVRFDQGASQPASLAGAQIPTVRCVGLRLSQPVDPAPASGSGRRSSQSTAGSEGTGTAAGGLAKAREASVALVCAGQLSMVVRTAAAAASAASAASPSGGQHAPLSAPFNIRCNGLSIRMEQAVSASASGNGSAQGQPAGAESSFGALAAAPREAPRLSGLFASLAAALRGTSSPFTLSPELWQPVSRVAESVTNRATALEAAVEQSAQEFEGPTKFFQKTFAMAGRITARAAKIAQRSAELVGRAAALPLRLREGGAGSDGEGGDEEGASGKGTRPGPGGG
mmetsp:Transcript_34476/g.98972  ORF Transcript_34476/g.98972 Transcript_34476/m.98972 type:complete len:305 (-) Transcript_34476:164-1078(-)|eukprot:CAMPEP_0177208938 /NCGR_PEP_ID=MMETSP0367-20130122/30757_1 /TAXON_ID=447022 ORGANISM="Scrippsiella hangoei-like, Strain SHHI-4" /NCGR_SAMPLE_ID=MMETSP0367 /ASSEMBLY_ACC=CAM_ASM_000362 /LENGTH=304 /DNA_ID=CAMNT_0018657953 /DNA_START=174 /DNA_END=1088 /DNA_ORIENTATION=-